MEWMRPLGPISLLVTLFLAAGSGRWELLLALSCSLFAVMVWQKQGVIGALFLLLAAFGGRALFGEMTAWDLGLSVSSLIGLLTVYLSEEESGKELAAEREEWRARVAGLADRQEEIAKERGEAVSRIAQIEEKIQTVQIAFDDGQKDLESLKLLVSSLRAAAKHARLEQEAAEKRQLAAETKVEELLLELATYRQVPQVETIQKELKEARAEIRELKAGHEAFASHQAAKEEKLQQLKREKEIDEEQIRRLAIDLERFRAIESENQALRQQGQFLQERLTRAEGEMRALISKGVHEEKLRELSELNGELRQLRTQFEEKNLLLSETRKELFRTDTELQTLKKKEEEGRLAATPELLSLQAQVDELMAENRLLSELKAALQPTPRKKKQPPDLNKVVFSRMQPTSLPPKVRPAGEPRFTNDESAPQAPDL